MEIFFARQQAIATSKKRKKWTFSTLFLISALIWHWLIFPSGHKARKSTANRASHLCRADTSQKTINPMHGGSVDKTDPILSTYFNIKFYYSLELTNQISHMTFIRLCDWSIRLFQSRVKSYAELSLWNRELIRHNADSVNNIVFSSLKLKKTSLSKILNLDDL